MIPYDQIETLFLDAGNTLISMDFGLVVSELDVLGFVSSVDDFRRAEAAARPTTSKRLAHGHDKDSEAFQRHLEQILQKLNATAALPQKELLGLVEELASRIRKPGKDSQLWSWVMPRVPEALMTLQSLGLKLVVVSNSDGTVEKGLVEAGLRPHLDAVIDSAIAGYEKPDPRIFEHALEVADSDSSRTLHVGDMYHVDVEGSRRAGLHSILLDPFGDWSKADCDKVKDLWNLAQILTAAR